ncbi:MAG: tetratricopeptide repeat protein [Myxococcota bacterium]
MFKNLLLILLYLSSCSTHSQIANTRYKKELDLGASALKNEEYELARLHFIKALEFNKKSSQAYNSLGVLALKKNDYVQARVLFLKAISLNPDIIEAQANLGALFLEKGASGKAVGHLKAALMLNPAFIPALFNLGLAYLSLGYPEKAKSTFLYLTGKNKNDGKMRLYLAYARALEGKVVESAKDLECAGEFVNHEMKGFKLLIKGIIARNAGRYQESLQLLKLSWQYDAKEPALLQTGVTYLFKGELEKASSILQNLKEKKLLKRNYPAVLEALALLAQLKNKPEKMKEILREITINYPGYNLKKLSLQK